MASVRAVCGDDFELLDITTDPALEQRYREWIPLVKVDGIERFRYFVDEENLKQVL